MEQKEKVIDVRADIYELIDNMQNLTDSDEMILDVLRILEDYFLMAKQKNEDDNQESYLYANYDYLNLNRNYLSLLQLLMIFLRYKKDENNKIIKNMTNKKRYYKNIEKVLLKPIKINN